jgi:CBS domain-containing protein
MTFTLRHILEAKGPGVVGAHPSSPVSEVAELMDQCRVGSVLAVEGGDLRGIFTERDILHRIVVTGRDPTTTPLREVMTRNVRYAGLETPIDTAMRVMTLGRYRHLPVVEDHDVLGLVSIGDLVKWVARDLEQYVVELSTLIGGPTALPDLPWLPPPWGPLGEMPHAHSGGDSHHHAPLSARSADRR